MGAKGSRPTAASCAACRKSRRSSTVPPGRSPGASAAEGAATTPPPLTRCEAHPPGADGDHRRPGGRHDAGVGRADRRHTQGDDQGPGPHGQHEQRRREAGRHPNLRCGGDACRRRTPASRTGALGIVGGAASSRSSRDCRRRSVLSLDGRAVSCENAGDGVSCAEHAAGSGRSPRGRGGGRSDGRLVLFFGSGARPAEQAAFLSPRATPYGRF